MAAAFISNRTLPLTDSEEYKELMTKTISLIHHVYKDGSKIFLSDCSKGFNTFSMLVLLIYKVKVSDVELHLLLPCMNRMKSWTNAQKKCFEYILKESKSIEYYKEKYSNGCIAANNRKIIDSCDTVIAYIKDDFNGSFDALKYAKSKKKEILFLSPSAIPPHNPAIIF